MKKEELRVIPKKNYIILGVVIVITLLLVYYFYMWFDAYKETKLNQPILDKYMEMINYNELDNFLTENPDVIIYVSVLENQEIRDFEKKLKTVFKNKELDREMFYLDITNDTSDNQKRYDMDSKYSINLQSIINVPVIMVFDDGELKSLYSISLNGYDIEALKLFINSLKFSGEAELNG